VKVCTVHRVRITISASCKYHVNLATYYTWTQAHYPLQLIYYHIPLIFHMQVIRISIDACCGVHLFCVLLKFDILYWRVIWIFQWHYVDRAGQSSLSRTDIRRLTTGIRFEKCVVRRFRRCANVIECNFNCCLSLHVDNYTIIVPTKCTSLLKAQDITICTFFFIFLAPTCFGLRGPSSGGAMPVPN
jgi:hypothetical protein